MTPYQRAEAERLAKFRRDVDVGVQSGLSYAEIARRVGKSRGYVWQTAQRNERLKSRGRPVDWRPEA